MSTDYIPKPPQNKGMISTLCYWLSVGLGSGLAKKAPGTFGSLAALVFLPLWLAIGFIPSAISIMVLTVVGVFICDRAANDMGVHDSGHIVWDEWAGQWIALLPLIYGHTYSTLSNQLVMLVTLLSFILFRGFDILKPWPISYLDKHMEGGLGIMVDDVIAGFISAVLLFIFINLS